MIRVVKGKLYKFDEGSFVGKKITESEIIDILNNGEPHQQDAAFSMVINHKKVNKKFNRYEAFKYKGKHYFIVNDFILSELINSESEIDSWTYYNPFIDDSVLSIMIKSGNIKLLKKMNEPKSVSFDFKNKQNKQTTL